MHPSLRQRQLGNVYGTDVVVSTRPWKVAAALVVEASLLFEGNDDKRHDFSSQSNVSW